MTADDPRDPFTGGGEVGALALELDWPGTPLGPVETWPASLRSIIRTVLASPFPMNLWCGPTLTLIYNDAYREVLGAKHPAAFGRPGQQVWSEIWPEIEPMFEQIRRGGPSVYADDAPFVIDRSGGGGDSGPNAWFTFSLSPVRDETGEIVAFLNVVSESTRRVLAERSRERARARAERAEARLREVFSQAPAFLALLRGPELIFEYANEAYYRLVGRRTLVGRPVLEALPEIAGQGFENLLQSVLRTGQHYVGREVRVLLSRGAGEESEERFVDFVYYPIWDEGPEPSGVVAHGSDVTDHVLARQEAVRARAEAEEANRAKSQFLATMSHEIRTPINAIMGYTDLLELGVVGPVTDRQKEHLEKVRVSSQHLLMLVDDILDLAKVEAGRLEIEYERASVGGVVGSAVSLIAPQASRREITVHRIGDEEQTFFIGDPDRVRQILINLLSNAVKFTPPGGEVTIHSGTVAEQPVELERAIEPPVTFIRVTDTGIGIAPAEVESIFRPFTQVETGHTRTQGGTGLGLTISRELSHLMGGDLTVESSPGRGSAFTLWLPSEGMQEPPLENVIIHAVHDQRPANLAQVGVALQAGLRPLLARYVERLRHELDAPHAALLPDATLIDHTSAFVADLAQSLVVLGTDTGDPEHLLQDGGEIQRLMARLHGRQRARLGWTAAHLQKEWEILRDEIGELVRTEAPADADVTGATQLLIRFIDRGERISRRTLRHAARN